MTCTICDYPLQQNSALNAEGNIWDLLVSWVAVY